VNLGAWSLFRLEPDHPDWIGDLAARIERRAFDRIVLNYRLDFEDCF
jgi:hypothetical protein